MVLLFLFERRSSSNYSRGSYQASSWRPAPPLLCKLAKWKTVGLIFETKIRHCRKKNTDRLELFCGQLYNKEKEMEGDYHVKEI